MAGFGVKGVRIPQLGYVESTVQMATRKGIVYKPQFVVLGQRLQTVRLPEWTPRNKNQSVYNRFSYLCKDHKVAAENTQRDVGKVQAMAQSCGLEGAYEGAWEHCVEYQNALPDQTKFWQAIANELQTETG